MRDRPWFMEASYPDRPAFAFGTVFAPTVETALAAARKLWGELFPHPMPPAERLRMVPGAVIVRHDDG